MNFLNPWFALAIAGAVIPALLILYFLKLRRREEPISSTLLWKRAVQDLQVNAPFQRLRKNLLLLLQLLVLAAALFALARPIVETTVADEERVVILIDRSASMNTVEPDGQTRFEKAREQAIRLVQTFNQRTSGWRSIFSLTGAQAETQVMVVAFSDRASIVSPFTTNTNELVDLIRRLEPTDARTEMKEALSLAEAYMAPPTRLTAGLEDTPVTAAAPARLVLISDGRIADLPTLALRAGTLEMIRVGKATDNVGITALRTRRNYERPESVNVFLTVRNFGPDPVRTDVSIKVDGTLRSVETVQLAGRELPRVPAPPADTADETSRDASPPGQPLILDTAAEEELDRGTTRSVSFDILLDQTAVIEAQLSRDDALPTDNRAAAVIPPPRRQRVLVVTKGNLFLDSVLRGLPLLEYPFITPDQYRHGIGGPYDVAGQSPYDVVIFDKHIPENLPAGNYLVIGTTPELTALEVTGTREKHALIWWDETHPILRHVALDPVVVGESLTVKPPPEAEILIEGPDGPVLFRYAEAGRHYLVLTFAIENSNWWSKPGFPVFIYNAIRYLGGSGSDSEGRPTRPGDTLRVAFPPAHDEVRLITPDGDDTTLTRDAFGGAYFGDTDQVGLYRAQPGLEGRDRFAVNLEDEWESDIILRPEPPRLGTQEIQEMAAIETATPEVWRWFVGGALILLMIEWWIYNRRVML